MTSKAKIKIIVTAVAVSAVAAHLIFPKINIDIITVFLLGIALLPWLESLFKSVGLPGGIQFQFHDLSRVETDARNAGLITPGKNLEYITLSPSNFFVETVQENKNLALPALRIEIEKKLREVAASRQLSTSAQTAAGLIDLLGKKNIFSYKEATVLQNMLSVLNRSACQLEQEKKTAQWVIDNGPSIISNLAKKIIL
jgi:hypothetical protein